MAEIIILKYKSGINLKKKIRSKSGMNWKNVLIIKIK